jgi:hypothetical protein
MHSIGNADFEDPPPVGVTGLAIRVGIVVLTVLLLVLWFGLDRKRAKKPEKTAPRDV